jgi:hypothetical protein
MSSVGPSLATLVAVDADFKPAVYLPDHFNNAEQNAQLIRTYIPTLASIDLLTEVANSLRPASQQRASMLHGTFGTGKSDLLLILCNYFSRPVDDPVMQPFYEKLRRIDETRYNTIYQMRANIPPFLVVLLQANAVTPFVGFILHGLEQALKAAGLEELMLPTRFSAARQQIKEWQSDQHPVLEHFITALRSNEGMELARLTNDLNSSSADSVFPAFQRAFKKATGTDFDIYSYGRPEDAFKSVAKALRTRGSHSGVVVVCDEFTELMRRMTRMGDQQSAEVDAEAQSIQDLANASIASGQNQLHFIVASLEAFASASAESGSATSAQALEKIGGRFPYQFALDLQESVELIRGALRRLDDQTMLLPNRQRDELITLTQGLWSQKSRQWCAELVVDGCFPLHPLTTYALPTINHLVAQTNRTMFQFLKDQEGLVGFLEQTSLGDPDAGWSNLLTLDHLFDYFERSIQERRTDVTDAYNHALTLSLHLPPHATILAQRVLKVLAFCEVVRGISPTRHMLRQALNLPPSATELLRETLELLERCEAIYPPHDTDSEVSGAYALPIQGRVSPILLRRRVLQKARDLPISFGGFQAKYSPESISATTYNQDRGSDRELVAQYILVHHLITPKKEELNQHQDGLLWYVLATSEEERRQAQSRARELTRQQKRLVVAIPTAPLNILDVFKNYQALEALRADTQDSATLAYLQDNGRVGCGFVTALTSAVDRLRTEREWEWFVQGEMQPNITNRQSAQALATQVMRHVFPATPQHQLRQHLKKQGISSSLRTAVADLLREPTTVSVSKNGNSAQDQIVKTGLVGLGLIKPVRSDGSFQYFSVAEPSTVHTHSQTIWRLYHDHLKSGRSWRELVEEKLRQPPYGLYDSLIFAFTGAFFAVHADMLELRKSVGSTVRPVALDDASELKELVEKPQAFQVDFQYLSDRERQWLQSVRNAVINKMSSPTTTAPRKRLTAQVTDEVAYWLNRQPLPLFAEQLDAERLSTLMPEQTNRLVLNAVPILLRMRSGRAEHLHPMMLLQELPACFGAPSDPITWTNETMEMLRSNWTETCQLIQLLPKRLEQHAIQEVAKVFGCQDQSADAIWGKIYHWRTHRRIPDRQLTTLSEQARNLLFLSNQPVSNVREVILNRFARSTPDINRAYVDWQTIDYLDRLVRELQKAYNEIQTCWEVGADSRELWFSGLAKLALGRPVEGVDAEKASRHLATWAGEIRWSGWSTSLQPHDLAKILPGQDAQCYTDLHTILSCTGLDAAGWQDALDRIQQQFGVINWTREEVQQALKRLEVALRSAAELDVRLRKHVLERVLQIFSPTDLAQPTGNILADWQRAYPIPADNDLDEHARTLLAQLRSPLDAETTLLTTLPQALKPIGCGYQEWKHYANLDHYVKLLDVAARSIQEYEPLNVHEQAWLLGIITGDLLPGLSNPPREKRRLAQEVTTQLSYWLDGLRLPAFAVHLTTEELAELYPDAPLPLHDIVRELLRRPWRSASNSTSYLLVELPQRLGVSAPSSMWNLSLVHGMLETIHTAFQQIATLQTVTSSWLIHRISTLFQIARDQSNLMSRLHAWRRSHVLLTNEALSPEAATVATLLGNPGDHPSQFLLTTLPSELNSVRSPYHAWNNWSQSTAYLQALERAVQEITRLGKVTDATPRAQQVWTDLKTRIRTELSPDEQRWLIKSFQQEFNV